MDIQSTMFSPIPANNPRNFPILHPRIHGNFEITSVLSDNTIEEINSTRLYGFLIMTRSKKVLLDQSIVCILYICS